MRLDIPRGVPLFLSDKNYKYVKEKFDAFEGSYNKRLRTLEEKSSEDDLNFKPQLPTHLGCQICKVDLKDSRKLEAHFETVTHKISVKADKELYDAIDDLIEELNFKSSFQKQVPDQEEVFEESKFVLIREPIQPKRKHRQKEVEWESKVST